MHNIYTRVFSIFTHIYNVRVRRSLIRSNDSKITQATIYSRTRKLSQLGNETHTFQSAERYKDEQHHAPGSTVLTVVAGVLQNENWKRTR